jgi:peptidoglycan/LPS O-acetylase OafA/YrhL
MLEIPKILENKKLSALDGLRGISIVFVILSHFLFSTDPNENSNLGLIGVDIFFVISGFLITTLLLKEKIVTGNISLKKFYIRRALRILPVVVLFLAVLFCLKNIFHLPISNLSFIASLLFIKNLPIPNCGDWWTGHFWSLGIEEQFYLLFPFLLTRLSIDTYKKIIITLICLIPIVDFLFYNKIGVFYSQRIIHNLSLIFVNVIGRGTALILVGSLLSVLMFTKPNYFSVLSKANQKFLSLLIFLFSILTMVRSSILYIQYFSEIIFAFLIGIVIILNLKGSSHMARFLNLKIVSQVGILSYSLYIWQQIFTRGQPWKGSFNYSDSVIFNLPLLIIVGYLSYYLYERKFLKLKNKFTSMDSVLSSSNNFPIPEIS